MNRITLSMLFIGLLAWMTACKKNDPKPSLEGRQLQKMEGTWRISSVTVDGTTISDQYANFALTIYSDASGYKWVAANGLYAFPSVGVDTWSFVEGSQAAKITRLSDNVEISIQATDTTLTLDFTVVSPISGRAKGLEGHFIFVLTKSA